METYRNNESTAQQTPSGKPKRRKRPAARGKALKKKDLTKYLTLEYVQRALAVIDHRLARNDSRTAKYVLEMYFGKAGVARLHNKPAAAQKKPAERKPNLHISSEFIEKLAQKYFPKPDWDNGPGNGGHVLNGGTQKPEISNP